MTSRRSMLASLATLALFAPLPGLAFPGSTQITPSGKVVRQSRDATGFTAISLAVPGHVELRQGARESVSVEADDNLLPEIETIVENGTLRIRFRRNVSMGAKATIRVAVTAMRIDSLSISGSGDIDAPALDSPALSIAVGGSGDARIERLGTESLKVSIAGSGDVKVTGRAAELVAKIAGSGDLVAGGLESKRATVSIAGSGDATVWARDSLEVAIAGSGDVRYHGDPSVNRRIAGSGTVKRLGPSP